MAGSALTDVNGRGLLSARPSAGRAGRNYYGTDTLVWYRDNGSSWDTQSGSGIADPTTTRGDMLFRNNSGAVARLALGAANTVLHGSATDPSYSAVLPADMDVSADVTTANATSGHHGFLPKLSGSSSDVLKGDGTFGAAGGAGALVFLEAHAANNLSTVLEFLTFISSTYDTYKIEGVGLKLATNAAHLQVEIGTGGTPTWDAGNNYEWARLGFTSGGAANNDSGSSSVPILFKSLSNNAAYGTGSFSITATNLQSTALRKTFHGTLQYADSAPVAIYGIWGMQWTTSGTAATALRFVSSAGNIESGTIRIYGVSKS